MKEVEETYSRKFIIYFLEKNYDKCFIISTNRKEKEKFFKEIENYKLIQNQRLVNKAFIIYQLYNENMEDMTLLLSEKEKEEFQKLLFYLWRVEYGIYSKKLDEEIEKIKNRKSFPYLIEKLSQILTELEDAILSLPLTDDELKELNNNFDHKIFYQTVRNHIVMK